MNGRWYSITIHSTHLESLRRALAHTHVDSDTRQSAEAILRQVERHIKNERTITEWERELDE